MMNVILLVHYKQQMFYAKLLQHCWSVNVTIISHPPVDSSVPFLDINNLIPSVIGYHPHMDVLVNSKHTVRTFIHAALDGNSDIRCDDIERYGSAYRYCTNIEDAILQAQLRAYGNIVLGDNRNRDLMDMRSNELREVANAHLEAYQATKFQVPEISQEYLTDTVIMESIPEDRYSEFQQASVTTKKDKEGDKQSLQLSPTNGPDTLPDITILTDLRGLQVTECQQLLLQRCWLDNRYPTDKITWVVLLDIDKPEWWTWGGDKVQFQSEKDNAVTSASASSRYVVVWQPNVYYYPHSTYAKVKLLEDHPVIDVVGTVTTGIYNILGNYGYAETMDLPQVNAVAYRKGLCVDANYFEGRRTKTLLFPFNYNSLSIEMTEQAKPYKSFRDPPFRLVSELMTFKFLTFEVQRFFNKLYRKLILLVSE
jgi:hypothetical protein